MSWLSPRNWAIRVRLTVLYGGLFFIAGAVLMAVTYLLVRQSLFGSRGGVAAPDKRLVNVLVERPITYPPGSTKAQAAEELAKQIAQQQEEFRNDTLNSLLINGGLALLLVGLAAVGLGWLMAERVLRPLHRITDTARRIGQAPSGASGLHERIALSGPRDEITELADTFDTMLERLDRSFDGQRRFVVNASHELRTPLAINRALLEVAVTRPDASSDVRQLGGTLLAVNARHERLIDGLLTLAQSEHEVVTRTPVDLAQIVEYVVDETAAQARSAGVSVTVDAAPAQINGDPVLLERLVTNLVLNGIRHNLDADGWVRAATRRSNGVAELVISNTGPTVPAYETEAIFEPFRRLGSDRLAANRNGSTPGVGLGLSIVRAVARAHGGDTRAESRKGGGLVVKVRLPA
jgi:signal transduction histidine kinase